MMIDRRLIVWVFAFGLGALLSTLAPVSVRYGATARASGAGPDSPTRALASGPETLGVGPQQGSRTDPDPIAAAAYLALTDDDAGRDVRLARWTNHHGAHALVSRIAVTNVTTRTIAAFLSLYDYDDWPIDGCGEWCTANLSPGATHSWWLGDFPVLREQGASSTGRALVRSTGPVVVAVHEVALSSDPATAHDSSAYAAVAADSVHGHGTTRLLPVMLDSARLGAIGAGDSSVDVWNLHPTDATTATLSLWSVSETRGITLTEGLMPGTGMLIRPFASLQPADGVMYSGRVTADRSVAALVRTTWPEDGGAADSQAADPGTNLVLPLVTGAFVNRCSHITLQSTNPDTDVQASLGFYGAEGVYPKHVMRLSVPSRRSTTVSPCADAQLASALGLGFVGSLRVASMDGETQFAVQTHLDVVGTRAVTSWTGVPADRAATILHAPIVHSDWLPRGSAARLRSAIVVTNVSEDEAEMLARFRGVEGDCAGEAFEEGPLTIAGRGSILLEPSVQGQTPPGCVLSASIESSARVVAVVYDEGYAAPESAGGLEALLPYAAR